MERELDVGRADPPRSTVGHLTERRNRSQTDEQSSITGLTWLLGMHGRHGLVVWPYICIMSIGDQVKAAETIHQAN
jgi:hypothetical protein|uniref:Uncharacterized protein n=1 Tax=Picea glauca TaxID=3330 RepID=A0A124GMP2_PICGL|nr:hypothetical protein ABT39_MTgene1784 [Picea glauca]QHR90728.1 hypothetical protein Q903MT_gene4754 [Picea sitchensis]